MKFKKVFAASAGLIVLAGIWLSQTKPDFLRQSDSEKNEKVITASSDARTSKKSEQKADNKTDLSEQKTADKTPDSGQRTVPEDPHEWEDPERPLQKNDSKQQEDSDSNGNDSEQDNTDTGEDKLPDEDQSSSQPDPLPQNPDDLYIADDDQGGFGKLQ